MTCARQLSSLHPSLHRRSSSVARRAGASLMLVAGLLISGSARAETQALDDSDLADVYGQGVLDITNTQLNGLQFSRVTLNADILLNANFSTISLGNYAVNGVMGTDINVGTFNFGVGGSTVALTNPYFEVVYSNTPGATQQQVVGMRFGFQGVAGNFGTAINSLSGSISISNGSGSTLTLNGQRLNGTTCGSGACPFALSSIGSLQAGNASGPSQDFFLAIEKQAVQYPIIGNGPAPALAQPGFWLNWTDKLTATNLTGTVPANPPKIGG